jgi:GTPase SAR1 family protein
MSTNSTSPPWDYIAKLVCIGDSGCGKSSLTIRLCEGRFSPQHDVTIGVEFGSRIVPVGPPHSRTLNSSNQNRGLPEPPKDTPQKHMKLSLWDTAGQETVSSSPLSLALFLLRSLPLALPFPPSIKLRSAHPNLSLGQVTHTQRDWASLLDGHA